MLYKSVHNSQYTNMQNNKLDFLSDIDKERQRKVDRLHTYMHTHASLHTQAHRIYITIQQSRTKHQEQSWAQSLPCSPGTAYIWARAICTRPWWTTSVGWLRALRLSAKANWKEPAWTGSGSRTTWSVGIRFTICGVPKWHSLFVTRWNFIWETETRCNKVDTFR